METSSLVLPYSREPSPTSRWTPSGRSRTFSGHSRVSARSRALSGWSLASPSVQIASHGAPVRSHSIFGWNPQRYLLFVIGLAQICTMAFIAFGEDHKFMGNKYENHGFEVFVFLAPIQVLMLYVALILKRPRGANSMGVYHGLKCAALSAVVVQCLMVAFIVAQLWQTYNTSHSHMVATTPSPWTAILVSCLIQLLILIRRRIKLRGFPRQFHLKLLSATQLQLWCGFLQVSFSVACLLHGYVGRSSFVGVPTLWVSTTTGVCAIVSAICARTHLARMLSRRALYVSTVLAIVHFGGTIVIIQFIVRSFDFETTTTTTTTTEDYLVFKGQVASVYLFTTELLSLVASVLFIVAIARYSRATSLDSLLPASSSRSRVPPRSARRSESPLSHLSINNEHVVLPIVDPPRYSVAHTQSEVLRSPLRSADSLMGDAEDVLSGGNPLPSYSQVLEEDSGKQTQRLSNTSTQPHTPTPASTQQQLQSQSQPRTQLQNNCQTIT